jgi:hypothetical protein
MEEKNWTCFMDQILGQQWWTELSKKILKSSLVFCASYLWYAKFILVIFFQKQKYISLYKKDGNWGLRKTTPGGPREEHNGAVLSAQSRAVSNIHKLQKNVLQTIFFFFRHTHSARLIIHGEFPISKTWRKVWSTLGWLAKKYLHLSRDNIWN